MPNAIRRWRRALTAAVFTAAAAAGCETEPDGPLVADLQLAPVIAAGAHVVLPIDGARVLVIRAPDQTVIDTLVAFPASATQLSIRLRVPIRGSSEQFTVNVSLVGGSVV